MSMPIEVWGKQSSGPIPSMHHHVSV